MASKMKAKSKKVMIVCPHCDKEFDVSQFEKLTYEQGKSDGRKQTLEEVLKEIKKYKLFWNGQADTFNFSKEMRFNLTHQLDLIEKYLKQKIKELSK